MPTDENQNLTAKADALGELYAAINRNDVSAALVHLDAQIERVEPPAGLAS